VTSLLTAAVISAVAAAATQANYVAVQDAVATGASQVLALQVLRLRQSVEAMSAQLRAAHSKDLVDNLRAKQALQGKDRQPRVVAL
jgi:outer membrane murein-binding lipoprotein Lpp